MKAKYYCMDKQIGKWLLDVINVINEIESFFEENEKHFEQYKKSTLLKRGIVKMSWNSRWSDQSYFTKEPEIAISNARQIVQFRNWVIHSYDNISDENVWAIVINHLPKLKEESQKLLEENFPDFPIIP